MSDKERCDAVGPMDSRCSGYASDHVRHHATTAWGYIEWTDEQERTDSAP